MRRIHYLTCALLALSWTAPLVAQQPTGTIRGRITDNSTQQPIAGVLVSVGNRSARTQPDGRYTITGVPAGSDLVHARLIGYTAVNQPVMVTGGDTVSVDLALDAQALNLSAIVVTGYGEQRLGAGTGAVSSVSDSQFNTGRFRGRDLRIERRERCGAHHDQAGTERAACRVHRQHVRLLGGPPPRHAQPDRLPRRRPTARHVRPTVAAREHHDRLVRPGDPHGTRPRAQSFPVERYRN